MNPQWGEPPADSFCPHENPSQLDRDEAVLRFWSGVEVSISLSPFVLVRQHGGKLASCASLPQVVRHVFFEI